MTSAASQKTNILLFGGGAVGAIAAVNIETGGLGTVTAVLRSNFQQVTDEGYRIESVDHGKLTDWRPTKVVRSVPDVKKESLPPFDYIVATTKNCPDVPPGLADLIAPAITPGHTVIVLIQNGLNIEQPIFRAFPTNIVLSGVSMIGCYERQHGEIFHDEHDSLYLGAFHNPNISDPAREIAAAHDFIRIYGAGGKTTVAFSEDVPWSRWRKLVYNAALNPLCAITGLDDARVRLTNSMVDGLVKPAMQEIVNIASKLGHKLPDDIVQFMIDVDPIEIYFKPSMQVDMEKGNLIEFENLVGEPLREAEKAGVPAPTLKIIYELCKALQWKIKEKKGLVTVPPKRVL